MSLDSTSALKYAILYGCSKYIIFSKYIKKILEHIFILYDTIFFSNFLSMSIILTFCTPIVRVVLTQRKINYIPGNRRV